MPIVDKGNCTIKNTNGKITVSIPNDLSFDLEAHNRNGRFHIGLNQSYDSSAEGKGRLIKLVGSGGRMKLRLFNENGSINIMDQFQPLNDSNDIGTKIFDQINKVFSGLDKDISKKDKFEKLFKSLKIDKKQEKTGDKSEWFKMFSFLSDEDSPGKIREEVGNDSIEMNRVDVDLEEKIFKMVEEGTITSEEAEKLLNAIK